MTTKTTLYDLTAEGLAIFDMLADNLGELTPELEQRLDRLMLEGPERIEAAAMVVRTLEQNAKACEEEAQRLRDRAKSFDAQADRLKLRMTKCLDAAFNGKVKTPLFTIYTQKSADRTVAELMPGITAEMLHKSNPELVRVKMELDREKCVEMYKDAERRTALPELLLFEEREGSRYVRIR
jgi:hypothetical protein